MNQKIDIIDELTSQLQPTKVASNPLMVFIKWAVVSVIYISVLAFINGTRPDLAAKFSSSIFLAEIGSLALIIITCGIAISFLAFPDCYQKKWVAALPALSLLVLIAVLYQAYQLDNPPSSPPAWHGMECTIFIALASFIPAFLSFYLLKKNATTNRFLAGSISALAAAALGCLSLRLEEKTDSIIHLIEWHYIPIIGFVSLGLLVGAKILKW